VLTEYFACSDKFDCSDIDFAALVGAAGPCERFTPQLAITSVHPESWASRRSTEEAQWLRNLLNTKGIFGVADGTRTHDDRNHNPLKAAFPSVD
jgi:hypothetical protein